jgi:hypothetical protein
VILHSIFQNSIPPFLRVFFKHKNCYGGGDRALSIISRNAVNDAINVPENAVNHNEAEDVHVSHLVGHGNNFVDKEEDPVI